MGFLELRDLYWLLVIATIKVASWSPSHTPKELLVSRIALTAYHLSRHKRLCIEENLSKAFGTTLSEEQKQQIARGAFHEYWKDVFSILPCRAERAALRRANVKGIEYLQRALENGKGAILWESQFGSRMFASQILHEHGYSVRQVHAETHLWGFKHDPRSMTWVTQHVVRRAFESWERRFIAEIIYLPRSNSLAFTRMLLKRLKQNGIICVTGDGRLGQKFIPLRFLGWTDFYSPGMVSLAKTSGAPILPMFCLQDRNATLNLIIEHPISIDTSLDRERSLEGSLEQYISLFESYVKRYPEKYLKWDLPERIRRWLVRDRIYESAGSASGR
jgi:lauroyl/myristoyl acyltransferase